MCFFLEKLINGLVFPGKFNLVVPLLPNQMLLFDLDKEATKLLNEGPKNTTPKLQPVKKQEKNEGETLFGMILSVFGR